MIDTKYNVGIIGLGYVGSPLAYLAAINGYKVIGIDNDIVVIDKINKRANAPMELNKDLKEYPNISLFASSDYSLLTNVDIIIICIPTPTKNNKPDLSIMKNVINKMSKFIKKGCLIIIESTVAPGMTKKYVEEYLLDKAGLNVNNDYDLAYCPERIDPCNKKLWVENINRVCGGSSLHALNRVCDFYKTIIKAKIIPMGSIEEAELVKVWENSMRNINIAQANLLAILCDKYNFSIDRLTSGLNSKIEQFGLSLAYPGLGPGGHCIPEDIHYLLDSSKNDININLGLLKESIIINENMPKYAFNKLLSIIKENGDDFKKMNILMLGISYKANSPDVRRSQALKLYDIIKKKHKKITILDPIADNKYSNNNFNYILECELRKADVVIISCAHQVFLNIDYSGFKNIKYLFDCWNRLDKENTINSKINYIGIGN